MHHVWLQVDSEDSRGNCLGDEYYGTFSRAWFTLFQACMHAAASNGSYGSPSSRQERETCMQPQFWLTLFKT